MTSAEQQWGAETREGRGREGKGGEAKGSPSPEKIHKPRAPYLGGYGHSALLSLPQESSPVNAPQDEQKTPP